MVKARICDPGQEGMFLSAVGDGTKPNIPMGIVFGVILIYAFIGVAIISDTFMAAIETITGWRRRVQVKGGDKLVTVTVWNETVATLTLMALGSSAPEIFLAVIENFKNGFHTGDLGPNTIVGSAAFNLFVIIACCIVAIPAMESRLIENLTSFFVTAVFSIGAYMWMVFVLTVHGPDVVDMLEAALTLLFLPLLVWIAYSVDVGFLARYAPAKDDDGDVQIPRVRAHRIGFEDSEMFVHGLKERQEVDVKILRKGGRTDPTQFTYRTERMTAVPGFDFEDVTGTVEFEKGTTEASVTLSLAAKKDNSVRRSFRLILENSEPGLCDFDPEGDGDTDHTMLTIHIEAPGSRISVGRALDAAINKNAMRYSFEEWYGQIIAAFLCNGSWEDQAEASIPDWVFHIMSFPWRFIFSFVPPPSFFGGWLCFFVSIFGIGMCTALVSDVAEMFGCLLDVPDVVTATTFVALGTSMPDLFASLSAAAGDPTADASIVNVTGSNSVNVFLGLGIPWTCAAIFWNYLAEDRTPDGTSEWEMRYPEIAADPKFDGITVFVVESRNLGFCVLVFSGLCALAIQLIIVRRKFLGCELGGPAVPKWSAATMLVSLWLGFVSLVSWRVIRCEGAAEGHWCKASIMEQGAVCGGVGISIALICFSTFFVTMRYAKQAKAVVAEQRAEKRRTSQMQLQDDSEERTDDVKGHDPEESLDNLRFSGKSDAENEGIGSVPSLADLITPRNSDREGNAGKTWRSSVPDVKFTALTPSTPQISKVGSHKVSALPSWHARNTANVSVIFVAYHSSGKNETGFYTKASKPLRSVMEAWCSQHCLPQEKAIFTYLHKIVDPKATVLSLGHDPAKGPLVIRARPNHESKNCTDTSFDPAIASTGTDFSNL